MGNRNAIGKKETENRETCHIIKCFTDKPSTSVSSAARRWQSNAAKADQAMYRPTRAPGQFHVALLAKSTIGA